MGISDFQRKYFNVFGASKNHMASPLGQIHSCTLVIGFNGMFAIHQSIASLMKGIMTIVASGSCILTFCLN